MKKAIFVLLSLITVYGQRIVHTIDAPANDITGLAIHSSGYRNNELWAVSSSELKVYNMDAVSGAVTNSFAVQLDTNYYPNGLAYTGDYVYVGQWDGTINGGWAYEYTTEGSVIGRTSTFC